ncbi:MAG: 5'/3'-nucleotidase SurE [Chloroflexi bacterium]|nr:5'/3'-nucleotidase SurE [Chloroflexota bacterium]
MRPEVSPILLPEAFVSAPRLLILLTNDDGIRSPGLLAAARAVCDLADLLIVAPAVQQSGMGRGTPPIVGGSVTQQHLAELLGPQVDCHNVSAYSLTGSPAQAVIYGILALAPRRPDLVISGINYGENLGTCVTASGTVGAALQAAEFGIPAMAVSLETIAAYHYHHGDDVDWRIAAHTTRAFANAMLRTRLPFDVDVLKIDVPADARPDTPWRITRQSRQPYFWLFRAANQPPPNPGELVRLDYEIRINWETLEPDSDIHAFVRDRVIAVTPLSHDLTSRVGRKELETVLQGVNLP